MEFRRVLFRSMNMTRKRKVEDITGQKFGRLTAVEFAGFNKPEPPRQSLWLFKCECGSEKVISRNSVINGHARSCGCLRREESIERHKSHGLAHTDRKSKRLNSSH